MSKIERLLALRLINKRLGLAYLDAHIKFHCKGLNHLTMTWMENQVRKRELSFTDDELYLCLYAMGASMGSHRVLMSAVSQERPQIVFDFEEDQLEILNRLAQEVGSEESQREVRRNFHTEHTRLLEFLTLSQSSPSQEEPS